MANPNVQQLRADLAANRARLVGATNDVAEAIKPQNIAKESVAQVKQFAKAEFESVASQVRDDEGGWRTDRLIAIGGAVLGIVVFVVTINTIANRRTSLEARTRRALTR